MTIQAKIHVKIVVSEGAIRNKLERTRICNLTGVAYILLTCSVLYHLVVNSALNVL